MSSNLENVYNPSSNVMLIDGDGRIISRIFYNSKYVHSPYLVYYHAGGYVGFSADNFAEYLKNSKVYKVKEVSSDVLEFVNSNIVEVLG